MKNEVTEEIKKANFGEKIAPEEKIKNLTPELEKLENIRQTVKECLYQNKPIPKFQNLYELLNSTNLMIISHRKLSKNQGASTPGSKNESIENFSMSKMETLAKRIKNKTFKWENTKKIEIPRKGKSPRPLGIPNYSEKIIQNIILMILETIYEPIFEKMNKSFGFRTHKSCTQCIKEITNYKNQGLQWVVEGDIKGAFNNVHPPKLAKILNQYIDDKDFINIIYEACITPTIMKTKEKQTIIERSTEGTPQGSIISPILFNIYMHEFDKEVENILKQIKTENSPTEYKRAPAPQEYKKSEYRLRKLRTAKSRIENINKLRKLNQTEKNNIRNLKAEINSEITQRNKIPRLDYSKLTFRYFYNRYADDFVIFVNKNNKICEQIKGLIAKYLQEELKLTLSIEKTKITNISKDKITYLGYSIFMSKRITRKRYTKKITQARTGKQILVGIDQKRIFNKLIEKNYATTKKLEPIHNTKYTVLEPQQIIEHYNSVMLGIYNYYFEVITYKSQLNSIWNILYQSALKTLACKHQTTVSKIYKRYGWTELNSSKIETGKTRIIHQYNTLEKQEKDIQQKQNFAILINRQDIQKICKQITLNKTNTNPEIQHINDIWNTYKVNWRTKFKLVKFCSICGNTDNLEAHHIRKIGGPTINKKDTFTQNIMRNLNRKQLIVCQKCHNSIHTGKYNGMSLDDLYDKRIAQIESYLKADNSNHENTPKPIKNQKYTFLQNQRKIINHLI